MLEGATAPPLASQKQILTSSVMLHPWPSCSKHLSYGASTFEKAVDKEDDFPLPRWPFTGLYGGFKSGPFIGMTYLCFVLAFAYFEI